MKRFDLRSPVYFRNVIFGVEDGLVSTVGLLSGIAIAGVPGPTIFLTGVVLIFVEAFSMAAGSFLSEASVDEQERLRNVPRRSATAGIVMFISYFAAGLIPLFPYLKFDVMTAFTTSIVLSIGVLFILGFWSGVRGRSAWRDAWRMALVGGMAILVGVFAGAIAGV